MIGITYVTESIRNLMTGILAKPAKVIPGIILLCSLAKRPGLSCVVSFGRIIQEMANSGLYTEKMPDGSPNLMNKMVQSIVCEIFRTLKEDTNIQLMIPPGSLNVVSTGANSGGPFTATGMNINIGGGNAIIQ